MDPGQRIDGLLREVQSNAREHTGLDAMQDGDVGRTTWVAMRLEDKEADTSRVVTLTMSVDGFGTIGPPWDEAIANAMARLLRQFTVPPDQIGEILGD